MPCSRSASAAARNRPRHSPSPAVPRAFDEPWRRQIAAWQAWLGECGMHYTVHDELPDALRGQVLLSAMVLRVHQDQINPGAMVASLSVPWGDTRDERGGYHLVWLFVFVVFVCVLFAFVVV